MCVPECAGLAISRCHAGDSDDKRHVVSETKITMGTEIYYFLGSVQNNGAPKPQEHEGEFHADAD